MSDLISLHLRVDYREFCVEQLVLRQIESIFTSCNIQKGTITSEHIRGERRTLVEEYYSSLNWGDETDAQGFLDVISTTIQQSYIESEHKSYLTEICTQDGHVYDGHRIYLHTAENNMPQFHIYETESGQYIRFDQRLFISYSRVDEAVTKALADRMIKTYPSVWYDTGIVGGEIWWKRILKEIEGCDHFIYLLSRESISSEYCQKECNEAIRLGKNIIPVIIRRRTTIPDYLKDYHYIEMFDSLTVDGLSEIYSSILRLAKRRSIMFRVNRPLEQQTAESDGEVLPFVGKILKKMDEEDEDECLELLKSLQKSEHPSANIALKHLAETHHFKRVRYEAAFIHAEWTSYSDILLDTVIQAALDKPNRSDHYTKHGNILQAFDILEKVDTNISLDVYKQAIWNGGFPAQQAIRAIGGIGGEIAVNILKDAYEGGVIDWNSFVISSLGQTSHISAVQLLARIFFDPSLRTSEYQYVLESLINLKSSLGSIQDQESEKTILENLKNVASGGINEALFDALAMVCSEESKVTLLEILRQGDENPLAAGIAAEVLFRMEINELLPTLYALVDEIHNDYLVNAVQDIIVRLEIPF